MRDEVRRAFVNFSTPLEGCVNYLYLDVKGLVTVALGCLVDPVEYACGLPLVHPDGKPAARDEIVMAWRRVKARQDLAPYGGGSPAFRDLTSLRLTPQGIDQVVLAKLDHVEWQLRMRFPEWETWPADAQLATLSMAWACGAGFDFPMLERALMQQDWARAAIECHMSDAGNPGLRPRNQANRRLYENAQRVVDTGSNPEEFWDGPHETTGEAIPGDEPEGPAAA